MSTDRQTKWQVVGNSPVYYSGNLIISPSPSVIIWQAILARGLATWQIPAKRAQHHPNDGKCRPLIINCLQGLVYMCVCAYLLSHTHTLAHSRISLWFYFTRRGESTLGDLSLSYLALPFSFRLSPSLILFSSRRFTLFLLLYPSPLVSVSLYIPPSPLSVYFSIFLCLSFICYFKFFITSCPVARKMHLKQAVPQSSRLRHFFVFSRNT